MNVVVSVLEIHLEHIIRSVRIIYLYLVTSQMGDHRCAVCNFENTSAVHVVVADLTNPTIVHRFRR